MSNRNVKLKNLDGEYLYPYTENFPKDTTPVSGSTKTITSGAVYTALQGKLNSTATAARATADASGNDIASTYLKKTDTAAKATADADGNNIASTYLKKNEEGRGGLNLLVSQLQKAYAWTWSNTLSSGIVQTLFNGSKLSASISCSNSFEIGYSATYCIVDNKLYTINSSTGVATQFGTDSNYTQYYYNVAIKSGGIYFAGNATYAKWIDSSGTYTKIGYGCGIKNGVLMAFGTQSNTNTAISYGVVDNGGVWTDILMSNGSSMCGIRDGFLYKANYGMVSGAYQLSSLYQISTRNDFTHFGFYSSTYLYAYKGTECVTWAVNNLTTQNPDPYRTLTLPETVSKTNKECVLLADGRLYKLNSGYSLSLIDTDVLDLGTNCYLKSDGIYNLSKTLIQEGSFTSITGFGIFSGAGTVQIDTVYSVANPAANYTCYRRTDLTDSSTISAATTTTITANSRTYSRNTTKDSVFTAAPDDLKKQTPTKWELVNMINNL